MSRHDRSRWRLSARLRFLSALLVTALAIVTVVIARQQSPTTAPPPAPADQAPAPDAAAAADQDRSTFRAQTNYIRVDVFPTIDGKPVRDLTAADFEVFEDGVPQKIETFEHVEVQGHIPQEQRREPNTAEEGRAMAADPRARVFAIFLDDYHTEIAGSHYIRRPLVELLDSIIGPDDLFAVMTPEMSAADISLARRTVTTEAMLSKYWYWGRRDSQVRLDPVEQEYEMCFPVSETPRICADPRDPTGRTTITEDPNLYAGMAAEMIGRRREKRVLDALRDLSVHLGGLRDERKAVIVISDGWVLYRPNPLLMRKGDCTPPPQGPRIGVGPDGKLTLDEPSERGYVSQNTCERDRQFLANLDNWQEYRELLDTANRYNVSFYPIDPRGLPASDAEITADVPPHIDQAVLRRRIETLETLADQTDGLAVVNSNDLSRGVRKIVDDLTSYYLLGYYTTNTKLDGKFHAIKVRVKRKGVNVRARRGYRAATAEEITRGRALTSAAEKAAPPSAFQTAMGSLAAVRPDFRFLTSVSWIAAPIDDSVPGARSHVWVVGELDATVSKGPEWTDGATADVVLTAEDGVQIAQKTEAIAPPARAIAVDLPDVAIGPGEYALKVRLSPHKGGLPFTDTVHFTVPDQVDYTGPARLLRRSPATGPEFVATADPRYRRTDRVRVEIPVLGDVKAVTAELLDKTGKTMPLPVQTAVRTEEPAMTWARAELALAPLAPGDYAVETTVERAGGLQKIVTAFRVIP